MKLTRVVLKTPWPLSNRDNVVYTVEWQVSDTRWD